VLTIRRRGRLWHVRGTIRVGGETRIIQERTTGCHRKEDADAYRARLEAEIRAEILHGTDGRARRLTIADAGLDYINRPGGISRGDLWRLDQINDVIGDRPITHANVAFADFVKQRCAGLAPATVERFRAVFSAALNHTARSNDFVAPKIARAAPVKPRSITYLTEVDAERLIASYVPHVRPIAIVLAFQGLRIGEALRLDWAHVRWSTDTLFIAESKSGEPRTVCMHERSRRALHALWVAAGSPISGRVFLNRFGQPYADPREYRLPGGSPIKKAHATACRRAGIRGFRLHDWRHHWACHCVMSEIDLETLRLEGGWASLRMVERYATVSAEHRAQVMRRLGKSWANGRAEGEN
jgi:integrase